MQWLDETRESYDTVAENYALLVSGALERLPVLHSLVVNFAELARQVGDRVLDIGCGPGHVAGMLHDLGLDVVGLDVSPAMIEIARRDHPGPRFTIGSMTDIPCADQSAAGALLFWSLIHVPDDSIGVVLAEVFRVLRPGGIATIGFHVGHQHNRKTEGYGGLPMRLDVYLRPIGTVADRLRAAGFQIEDTTLIDADQQTPGGVVIARRPPTEHVTAGASQVGHRDGGHHAVLPDRQQELLLHVAVGDRCSMTNEIAAGSPGSGVPEPPDGFVGDPAVQSEWDGRYAEREQLWSGRPNGALVAEVAGLGPGRALDVGCGEGADAIWLADRGWEVTALEVSGVALKRAARHARDAGVAIRWVHAGLAEAMLRPASFDLVSAQYPALLRTPDAAAERALLAAVAPGGVLLLVHHAGMDTHQHDDSGFDPADYVWPSMVRALLDNDWTVEVDEQRPRMAPDGGAGAHHTHDVVLRARRLR